MRVKYIDEASALFWDGLDMINEFLPILRWAMPASWRVARAKRLLNMIPLTMKFVRSGKGGRAGGSTKLPKNDFLRGCFARRFSGGMVV
mmetsp:Transcript_11688/g.12559  ORF Transcript_11688/g.12559 Transcript_11688/m.12559 type:complete len:89 (+) Transcript_11688:124-390(+)